METLAALSVAAAAFQFVAFGLETLAHCREIVKKGKLDDHDDLQSRTERLKQLGQDVAMPVPSSRNQKIGDLGKECTKTAQELLDVLDAIYKSSGKAGSIRHSVKVFSRTMHRQSRLQKLETRLLDHQRILDTSILIDIRCVLLH